MDKLAHRIRALMRGHVGAEVERRIAEFTQAGRGGCDRLFSEMCFCILTANYAAEPAMRIQESVGGGFIRLPRARLTAKLRGYGYRFPNTRAAYICEARRHRKNLARIIKQSASGHELRNWLVENVKGLGMKEASHFLRNVGFRDVAIVDFHIVDVLVRHGLILRPKTLTRRVYLEIEEVLRRLASRVGVSLAELDMYLWYIETGKVLK